MGRGMRTRQHQTGRLWGRLGGCSVGFVSSAPSSKTRLPLPGARSAFVFPISSRMVSCPALRPRHSSGTRAVMGRMKTILKLNFQQAENLSEEQDLHLEGNSHDIGGDQCLCC